MAYRSRTQQRTKQRTRKRKGIPVLAVALIVLLVVAGGVGYYALANFDDTFAPTGPNASETPGAAPADGLFYDGVFVDGIDLGGLTMDQARQRVEEQQRARVDAVEIELTHAKGNLRLTALDLSYSFDTDEVLRQAFEQGRQGTKEENQAFIEQLSTNPLKLATTLSVDPTAAEQQVRAYAATLETPGTNAAFQGYDHTLPEGQRLQFTPDVPGIRVNPDTLWEAVKAACAANAYGPLPAQDEPLSAEITLEELQNDLQLVKGPPIQGFESAENKRLNTANEGHSYTTRIRNDSKARLTNIRLANESISGKLLMPGEVLSMNTLTGERTAKKGYQNAPVDQNGIEDVGLAGGVCQVSGTLYNAAIAAGPNRIEIVEREHHSIPSAYMAMGTDATVNYPDKDLQFKNITDKPMLIVIYYEKAKDGKYYNHADFYCVPEPEGAMYRLEGKVVQTLKSDANAAPRKVASNAVKPGETKLLKARKGYVVDTYLVKLAADGTETRTKLYQDKYPASGPVLAYYAKDPKPTDTPSATPTATPAPSDSGASQPTADPTVSQPADPPPAPADPADSQAPVDSPV